MNVLLIGDIVGRTGRKAVKNLLPDLCNTYNLDVVIANGENAAGGFGLTQKVAAELFSYGIDCLTMGNHTWDNKDILNIIDQETRIIRPLNYNPNVPGRGWTIINHQECKLAVINLVGQVFMGSNNSPFIIFDQHISEIKKLTDIIIVDFHAEATGEKLAFANYVDQRVSCVVGTHTHIQTADERILPGGTGYITDLGLTGAVDSILGMDKKKVIKRFLTQIPQRFSVGSGTCQLTGLVVKINQETGLTENVFRIKEIL